MVEVVATSKGNIPLNTWFGAPSFPLSVAEEARKFAEEHGFVVKEKDSDIILTNGDYLAKISNHIEFYAVEQVGYYPWESGEGTLTLKYPKSVPSWVHDFANLLVKGNLGKSQLDSLA
jgi:hypothetical protein